MIQTIPIQTNSPYDVTIGQDILERAYEIARPLSKFQTVLIVSDDNVAPLYLEQVKRSFPAHIQIHTFIIPHGEQSKNAQNLLKLMDLCAENSMTRSDLMIALGGGVVGDLTGFAASIYLRGIPYLQIPTSLLAQVDSSVGGKTAIDISAGKNLVGTFYQPAAVLCDTKVLSTLPDEVFHDGVAEIIKYGCIYDEALFEEIPKIWEPEHLLSIIKRCIEIKAEVVCQDELDKGLRMILNFGHTIGHAVEKYYHYKTYTHGQGVAIGMAFLTAISERAGLTKQGTTLRLLKLIQQFGLPVTCNLSNQDLMEICALDKKNIGGGLNLILLSEIGHAFVHRVTNDELEQLLSLREPELPENVALLPTHLRGEVTIPPSKSILHRALICASLAKGSSTIRHVVFSEDIRATMECMKQFGASFEVHDDAITVHGVESVPQKASFSCQESGSTLRFLIPIASAFGIDAFFTGKNRLVTRPLDLYESALSSHGVTVQYAGQLPFAVKGQLCSGVYQIKGNVSSQFITGLLFALPLLPEESIIEVLPPFESKSYVKITLQELKQFGIEVFAEGDRYRIPGGQQYKPCDFSVESDFSQAAFFLVADALGAAVTLRQFDLRSIQGDRAVLDVLQKAGCRIICREGSLTCKPAQLTAFEIDGSDIPDLVPILCVLACFCKGTSRIKQVKRLRIKESDRIASTMELIQKMGGYIHYDEENDCLTVEGEKQLHGAEIQSYNDHRIAMCAAVAAAVAEGVTTIKNAACVKKSYPVFFHDYRNLGGICHGFHLE